MSIKQPLLQFTGNTPGGESSSDSYSYNTSFFKFMLAKIVNPIPRLFTKKNIINLKPLSPFDRNNLKQGGFAIFLVAFILTIFEIVFFYLVVIPGINESKKDGLTTIANSIATKVNSSKNILKRDISQIDPISEDLIFSLIFGDFSFLLNDESTLNQAFASIGSSISSTQDLSRLQDMAGDTSLAGVSIPDETFENTLGDSIYSERKQKLINNIMESDMDESTKTILINFINDPEEFQLKKKRLLLKLLDTKFKPNNPVIETFAHRESLLREKINMYVLFTGIIIIFVLLMFLLKIRKSVITDVEFNNFKGGYKTAIKTSIITVLTLISFQYFFYLLSGKYLFTISGLDMCTDNSIKHFINIMKIKENKTYTPEEAQKYIFDESLNNTKGSWLDITFPGTPDVCRQNDALNNKGNGCIKRFESCHYLSKDYDKYGEGKNEVELIAMKNVKTR
jgi:hypothetical protein